VLEDWRPRSVVIYLYYPSRRQICPLGRLHALFIALKGGNFRLRQCRWNIVAWLLAKSSVRVRASAFTRALLQIARHIRSPRPPVHALCAGLFPNRPIRETRLECRIVVYTLRCNHLSGTRKHSQGTLHATGIIAKVIALGALGGAPAPT